MAIIISGYTKKYNEHFMPKCDKIVHHAQHAYNERGQVITVDIADEDRQAYIDSFAGECGLKNVLTKLVRSGDVLGYREMRYNDAVEAEDTSGFPTHVNEVAAAGASADSRVMDALSAFNKKTGLNLTLTEFEKAVADGKLLDLVAESVTKKETKEEGE